MQEERYILTKLPEEELTRELDQLWAEMQNPDSELSKKAAIQGIDLEPIRQLNRDQAIKIYREEAGFDVTHIVMAFVAHGVVEVVKATWLHLLYPRIKNSLGEDAIKPEPKE